MHYSLRAANVDDDQSETRRQAFVICPPTRRHLKRSARSLPARMHDGFFFSALFQAGGWIELGLALECPLDADQNLIPAPTTTRARIMQRARAAAISF